MVEKDMKISQKIKKLVEYRKKIVKCGKTPHYNYKGLL